MTRLGFQPRQSSSIVFFLTFVPNYFRDDKQPGFKAIRINESALLETMDRDRLPRWLSSKESACYERVARDTGSIPELRRSPGGVNGNPLQYSCLEKPMDRGTWWVTVHMVSNSWTWLKRLSMHACKERRKESWGPVLWVKPWVESVNKEGMVSSEVQIDGDRKGISKFWQHSCLLFDSEKFLVECRDVCYDELDWRENEKQRWRGVYIGKSLEKILLFL